MKSRQIKAIGWMLSVISLLILWVLFAPTKLGGSAVYSITKGISMQPLLHKNDLALVRAQPTYHVGDIVLYDSSTLHRPVLHRIIFIQGDHYYFKGDNNNFVDPGYATRSELEGKLWLHLPKVGGWIAWIARPAHAAILSGVVVVLFIGTSFTVTKRRRRPGKPPSQHNALLPTTPKPVVTHHEKSSPSRRRAPPTASSVSTTETSQIPSYFEGPIITLAALGTLVVLALLCLLIGFSRPSHDLVPLTDAYRQSGNFTYTAPVKTPTVIYPSGTVKTGDPIFPSLVDAFTIRFKYRFDSALPHSVKGTAELRALLLSKSDKWQELTVLKPTTAFTGDTVVIDWDSTLSDLYNLIGSVAEQSGTSSIDYSADVQPIIHVTGTVNGQHIDSKFEPVLPFTIGKSVITLNDTDTPEPPGAPNVLSAQNNDETAILQPSQAGSIPHLGANTVAIAHYKLSVPLIRLGGIVLVLLAAGTAGLHDILRRRQRVLTDDEIIAKQFQDLVVPVDSLKQAAIANLVEVPDFKYLAELAQYLERPILHSTENGRQAYAVDDGTTRYIVYEPVARAAPLPLKTTGRQLPQKVSKLAHRIRNSKARFTVLVLFLLVLTVTLVSSFTASNTVPATHVGQSVNARTIAELTPTGCNTLSLTSLILKSAGSSSNTTSNALILGTSGVETLNDTGNDNCIVGGAGKDNITAKSTSICISGPTNGATYTGCTKK